MLWYDYNKEEQTKRNDENIAETVTANRILTRKIPKKNMQICNKKTRNKKTGNKKGNNGYETELIRNLAVYTGQRKNRAETGILQKDVI